MQNNFKLVGMFSILLAISACQTVELPTCYHDCYIGDVQQDRGGNSPTTNATIPLIP